MAIDYSDQVDIAALVAAIDTPLGGLRLRTGSFVLAVGTTEASQTVTFAEAFASAPMVFCTPIDTGAVSSGERKDKWGTSGSPDSGLGSTTGFVFKSTRATGSANVRVNWFAIGV